MLRSNNRKKCYYYKCNVNSSDKDVLDGSVSLFTIPGSRYEVQRIKEFLVRMNIANFESRIPFYNHLRICSKHFKEEDFQYGSDYSIQKRRKLIGNSLPTDWRIVYPEDVALVEGRTSFRPGDDILEYVEEQREFVNGNKVKIEHDYAKEECPNLIPSYVTRTDVELVRYVRASLTVDGDILALKASGANQVPTNHTHAPSRLTERQPAPSSPIPCEVVEEPADLMASADNGDDNELDQRLVFEIPRQKVCRLCGQQARNMIYIFGMDGLDMLLAEKINSILPIHVNETDDLPLQVCISCIDQVSSACKLFSRVAKVNKSLLKIYGPKSQDPIRSIMDSVGIDENDCNDYGDDCPDAFDDPMESEHCKLLEPPLFPIADDEDLLEVDDGYLDATMYEEAFESTKDIEFEPKYQQLLCTTCNVVIDNVTDYLDHQAVCHGRALVHCPLCVVFFSNQSELKNHWRTLHSRDFRARKVEPRNKILKKIYANVGSRSEPVWKCDMCQKSFNSITEFRINKRKCASKLVAQLKKQEKEAKNPIPRDGEISAPRRFKCDYCDANFGNSEKRLNHMLTHKEFVPYECNICHKLFKVKKCYDGHMDNHKFGKTYLCNTCGKMFATKDLLRSHQRTHLAKIPCPICKLMKKPDFMKIHLKQHKKNSVEKPVCLICQKTFMDELHYKKHICSGPPSEKRSRACVIQPGTNAFLCSYCESTFATPDTYMKHLKDNHPMDKYMYACSVCRHQSPVLHQLSIHLEEHEECLRYSCPSCPRRFSTSKRKVTHETSKHMTKKCPDCEKTVSSQNYNDHLNLHTGAKPYHCSVCNEHFRSKTSIIIHMQRHSGKQQDKTTMKFKCPLCDAEFATNGTLQFHMKNHTTDLPGHQCDFCEKKFWNKRKLILHRAFHTASRIFNCVLCDYACVHANTFSNHMNKRHATYMENNKESLEVVEEVQDDQLVIFNNLN